MGGLYEQLRQQPGNHVETLRDSRERARQQQERTAGKAHDASKKRGDGKDQCSAGCQDRRCLGSQARQFNDSIERHGNAQRHEIVDDPVG